MPRTKLTKVAGRLWWGGGMGGRVDTTQDPRRSSGSGADLRNKPLAQIMCEGSSGATVAMETASRAQGLPSTGPEVDVCGGCVV